MAFGAAVAFVLMAATLGFFGDDAPAPTAGWALRGPLSPEPPTAAPAARLRFVHAALP